MSRLILNPWLFLEATGEVYRGESATLFQSTSASDLTYVGHLRGYRDITRSRPTSISARRTRAGTTAGVGDGVDRTFTTG